MSATVIHITCCKRRCPCFGDTCQPIQRIEGIRRGRSGARDRAEIAASVVSICVGAIAQELVKSIAGIGVAGGRPVDRLTQPIAYPIIGIAGLTMSKLSEWNKITYTD